MKVLILCPYSYPSACGIWSRVYSDACALRDEGYEVHIFSSDRIKGTNDHSAKYEEADGLYIHRFRSLLSLGGSSMFWFFVISLLKLNPDIIHTHGFRHPHSLQALILGKLMRKKVILTTHGPFEKDPKRSIKLKVFDFLYDKLISWWELRLYSVVIQIAKWENKHLNKFRIKNTTVIPNGIKSEFLDTELIMVDHHFNLVTYMGRIDPIKRLEWIKYAAEKLPNIAFRIRGPVQGYDKFESDLQNLEIINEKYETSDFIEEMDRSDIFVLPSIRESFGIVILEAMSRGKVVISSDTKGGNELIDNGENGFIVENENELIEAIEYTYRNWGKLKSLRQKAVETAKLYDERLTTKKLVELYRNLAS